MRLIIALISLFYAILCLCVAIITFIFYVCLNNYEYNIIIIHRKHLLVDLICLFKCQYIYIYFNTTLAIVQLNID